MKKHAFLFVVVSALGAFALQSPSGRPRSKIWLQLSGREYRAHGTSASPRV